MSLLKLKQTTLSLLVLTPMLVSSGLAYAGNGLGGGGGTVDDTTDTTDTTLPIWTALIGSDTTDYGNQGNRVRHVKMYYWENVI